MVSFDSPFEAGSWNDRRKAKLGTISPCARPLWHNQHVGMFWFYCEQTSCDCCQMRGPRWFCLLCHAACAVFLLCPTKRIPTRTTFFRWGQWFVMCKDHMPLLLSWFSAGVMPLDAWKSYRWPSQHHITPLWSSYSNIFQASKMKCSVWFETAINKGDVSLVLFCRRDKRGSWLGSWVCPRLIRSSCSSGICMSSWTGNKSTLSVVKLLLCAMRTELICSSTPVE